MMLIIFPLCCADFGCGAFAVALLITLVFHYHA